MYAKGLDYDRQLMGLAFLDVNFYVTSIRVFKNFILISDLVKSVWLVSLNVSRLWVRADDAGGTISLHKYLERSIRGVPHVCRVFGP